MVVDLLRIHFIGPLLNFVSVTIFATITFSRFDSFRLKTNEKTFCSYSCCCCRCQGPEKPSFAAVVAAAVVAAAVVAVVTVVAVVAAVAAVVVASLLILSFRN